MDSINRQQPEHNREDLSADAAVERIRHMVDDAPNCYFCTAVALGPTSATRPMNVRQVDDEGVISVAVEATYGIRRIHRLSGGETGTVERFGQQRPQIGIVFDNQDRVGACHRITVWHRGEGLSRFRN